jgi:hypothetical protein
LFKLIPDSCGVLNDMSDEPPMKTKTDVLDLIIGFLMEHEKQLDGIVERLETLTEEKPRNRLQIDEPRKEDPVTIAQPDSLTLTINNPDGARTIKSIKIEWEETKTDTGQTSAKVRAMLDEIDNVLREG